MTALAPTQKSLFNWDECVNLIIARMLKEPQVPCPVVNHFSNGLYAREIHLPAGSLAIGVKHKTEHLCTLSKGILRLSTGDKEIELHAPCTFTAHADSQKVVYAVTDCVFTTYHATKTTDLKALKAELTYSCPALEAQATVKALETL